MLNVETNSVARKGRTIAKIRANPIPRVRSSKISRASGAGGQKTNDTHENLAASKVARKGGEAKVVTKSNTDLPPQLSAAKRARAQTILEAQNSHCARKISASKKPKEQWREAIAQGEPYNIIHAAVAIADSGRATKTRGKNKPRVDQESTPIILVRAAPLSDGQACTANHCEHAVAPSSAAHRCYAPQDAVGRATPQASWPLPADQVDTVMSIYGYWRRRQALVKAMTKLSLQAQATLRFGRDRDEAAKHYVAVSKNPDHDDYIHIIPYLEAMQPLERYRANHEKELVRLVKTLPIYGWAKAVSGLGDVSLAGLVGECSGINVDTNEWWSIGQMKSASAVWKRLGLAVMSGVRQGDATAGLSKADWVEHGYVKTRRSVVWNVGECIVKAQWRKENTVHAYGKFYGEEKARLQALNESGEYAEQAARIVERMKKAGSKPLAENLAGRLTPMHINNRAKRHMTKRLVKDLWVAWREADRLAAGYAPVAQSA